MTDRHLRYLHLLTELYTEPVDGFYGGACHFLTVKGIHPFSEHLGEHVVLFAFPVKDDVLGCGKVGKQGKLLMNHSDTRGKGIEGSLEPDFLSVEENLSAVAARFRDLVHTEQDLHERALSGTVFTHKAKYLALRKGEIHVLQDNVAEEIFLYVTRFKQNGSVTHRHAPLIDWSHVLGHYPCPRTSNRRVSPPDKQFLQKNYLMVKYFSGTSTSALPMKPLPPMM